MINLICTNNFNYENELTVGSTYDLLYDENGQFYIVNDNWEYGYYPCSLFGY